MVQSPCLYDVAFRFDSIWKIKGSVEMSIFGHFSHFGLKFEWLCRRYGTKNPCEFVSSDPQSFFKISENSFMTVGPSKADLQWVLCEQIKPMEITANVKAKLILVGHEAEMLYFPFSESDNVASHIPIFEPIWASTLF